jgi:hypothetical protein
MSTKIRVEKMPSFEDSDDWEEFEIDDEESSKGRKRLSYNGKKRRLIEDTLEERRLRRQIADEWDALEL